MPQAQSTSLPWEGKIQPRLSNIRFAIQSDYETSVVASMKMAFFMQDLLMSRHSAFGDVLKYLECPALKEACLAFINSLQASAFEDIRLINLEGPLLYAFDFLCDV